MHHSLYCPTYSLFHIFHFRPSLILTSVFPAFITAHIKSFFLFFIRNTNLIAFSQGFNYCCIQSKSIQVLGKYKDSWICFFLYFFENTCSVLSQNSKKSFENFKTHLYIVLYFFFSKRRLMAFSECHKSLILSEHRDDFVAKGNFHKTITLCPIVEYICPFQI